MNVIVNPADDDGLAIQVGQNASEVTMQFLAQGATAEDWAAGLGGEDRVNQDRGQGLRHGRECKPGAGDATLSGLMDLWVANPG
jgi:hypothetical protein